MDGQLALADIDAEVMRQADELTPDLLPRLLKILLKRDSLSTCERHDVHLFPYIRAQINLTRVKRQYYHSAGGYDCLSHGMRDPYADALYRATIIRDNIRKTYRATPCTCWVHHR